MKPARWEQIQTIFHEALTLADHAQPEFLSAVCHGDEDLLAQVRSMLAENSRADSILDLGLEPIALRIIGPPGDSLKMSEVGIYRLVEFIGEGGMGVVYLAERKDTGKQVAMKFLPGGALMSPARRDRFTHEIKLHASLAHPGIVAQYDAGALSDGTPWFVMEYVQGTHLVAYCQTRRSSLETRLNLFRAVCEVLEYLHGKGIIHRDLKPSNILVDQNGQPRVLDFGIAKELHAPEQMAERTRPELRVMSRAYAAPEWIEHGVVDQSTDVYSLGIILRQLLAGVSGVRKSQQRELDKICGKALNADSDQRYRSVETLRRDIDHFVRNEPLEAQPPSRRYRLQKFLTRHRSSVLAAAVALFLFSAMAVWFTIRLAKERNSAVAEGTSLAATQRLMLNMLGGDDPMAGPKQDLRVLTLLDRATIEAEASRADSETQAEIDQTVGEMYRRLGNFDKAEPLLRKALDKWKSAPVVNQMKVAAALIHLGRLNADELKFAEGDRYVRQGLSLAAHLPPNDPFLISAKTVLARVLAQRGSYADAIAILEPLVRIPPLGQEGEYALSEGLHTLAYAKSASGQYEDAKALARRNLALDQKLYGESYVRVGSELANIGADEATQGHYPLSEKMLRQAVAINSKWYGENNPDTLQDMAILAAILIQQSKFNEAAQILHRVLANQEQSPGHADQFAVTLDTLGRLELKTGSLDDAESHLAHALAIDRKLFGDNDHKTAMVKAHYAQVFMKKQQYAQAEPLLSGALYTLTHPPRPGNMSVPVIQSFLGEVLLKQKRYREAEQPLLNAFAALEKQSSAPLAPSRDAALRDLVAVYNALGDSAQASHYQSLVRVH